MTLFSSLARSRGGSVAIAFALSVVVLGLCVGLAVDTARVYSLTRKVQAALDAAALAGAKALNESDVQSISINTAAYAAFQANTANIAGADASFTGFSAIPDLATSSVNVGVRMRVPTTFARLAGLDEFDVAKSASTSYSMARIEVALALDVTGSMNDTPLGDTVTKLAALKVAATHLVDSLFETATTNSNVRIGLAPWSNSVLSGPMQAAVTGSTAGDGCVGERAGDGATTDSLPSPTTYAAPLPASSIAAGYICPNVEVLPLAGRLSAIQIKSKINDLMGAGGTAGHLGAAWAWYLLSQNWASLYPTANRPEVVSPNVVKAAIIMTDGVFNTSHVGGVLNSGTGAFNEQSYTLFKALCDGMRAQGIRVYTIAFDINDTIALDKLAECSGANALTAANSVQLDDAFRSIASDLNSIRITR